MSDEKQCCGNHQSKFWKGIFWGAVLGGVAGILFAPEKGERTRKILKRKAEDLKDRASELSQSLVEGKDELPMVLTKKVGEISDFLQKKKVDLEKIVDDKVNDILEDTDDLEAQVARPLNPKEVKKKPLKKGIKSFYKSGKH